MKRRDFITLVGGAAATWPLAAGAQQSDRRRRIGVIMNYAENDQVRLSALRDTLRTLGWVDSSNIRIESRWAAGKTDRMQAYATELVGMPADTIVVNSTPLLAVLRQQTHAIPIVFVQVADPVGSGFVKGYAQPGGNITGFTDVETSIAGKWIELLKEAAPSVNRVLVLLNPEQANHPAFWRVIQSAAASLKIEVSAAAVRDRAEIEHAITRFAGQDDRGVIALPSPLFNTLRDSIIPMAARYRLPAIYPFRYYAKEGGLLYYGSDQVDQWPKAAGYVDRILRGEKPSELPVQAPTKYELVINVKTAKALGLTIPESFLLRADEVIE